jgi:predicted Zn-dependent protease with MMP-like domain
VSAAARLRALRGVPQRYRTDRRTFDRIVSDVLSDVLAELSEQFGDRVSNVSVMVEDWPPAESEALASLASDEDDLLGLYQGIPLGARSSDYHLALPDRITIYRQPILAACRSEAETRREIRLTLLHEIGHYFGLGDDELP